MATLGAAQEVIPSAGHRPGLFPQLPVELQHGVLAFLPPSGLAKVAQLSHAYARLARSPDLWRGLARVPHQRWADWRTVSLTWKQRVRLEAGLPSRLRPLDADCQEQAVVAPDGLAVTCPSANTREFNLTAYSDRAVKVRSSLSPCAFYFEVRVQSLQRGGCVSIGFVSNNYPIWSQVGWRTYSCGWHSDDAKVFANQSRSDKAPLGDPWGQGDVVGCGLAGGHIFFVRNGVLQRPLFPVLTRMSEWRRLHPAVGVDRANLQLNFGAEPFVFDFADLKAALPTHVAAAPDSGSSGEDSGSHTNSSFGSDGYDDDDFLDADADGSDDDVEVDWSDGSGSDASENSDVAMGPPGDL